MPKKIKRCPKCNTPTSMGNQSCSNCGYSYFPVNPYKTKKAKDERTIIFVLTLFFPFIAFIFLLIWKRDYPNRSRAILNALGFSLIVRVIGIILVLLLFA